MLDLLSVTPELFIVLLLAAFFAGCIVLVIVMTLMLLRLSAQILGWV